MLAKPAVTQQIRYDYAIGDIQGCYDGLKGLLDTINFDDQKDRLWFVGDIVNRGKQSLEVVRFIQNLALKPRIVLGNHDFYLLSLIFNKQKSQSRNHEHTLDDILLSDDSENIGHWLRNQSIIIHDEKLNIVISHAGIAPVWNLDKAKTLGLELESALSGDNFIEFLNNMMGDKPNTWSESLTGIARLRLICNYFTRMRFCNQSGSLVLNEKGCLKSSTNDLHPWFSTPNRIAIKPEIIFGHWASLEGVNPYPHIHAIDTGYVWGGSLTALRIQDKKRFKFENPTKTRR
jgi:bis(5'-nucleosyl)-tetraphosphatase (symmetrical)